MSLLRYLKDNEHFKGKALFSARPFSFPKRKIFDHASYQLCVYLRVVFTQRTVQSTPFPSLQFTCNLHCAKRGAELPCEGSRLPSKRRNPIRNEWCGQFTVRQTLKTQLIKSSMLLLPRTMPGHCEYCSEHDAFLKDGLIVGVLDVQLLHMKQLM